MKDCEETFDKNLFQISSFKKPSVDWLDEGKLGYCKIQPIFYKILNLVFKFVVLARYNDLILNSEKLAKREHIDWLIQ